MFNDIVIKKTLSAVGIITLLALSYAAVAYVRVYDRSIQPASFRSFAVTGEGRAVAVPDIAEFTASVITQGGNNLAALQTTNTDKMNKVIDFIKSKGVDSKDIQTSGYRIEPRYQTYSCPSIGFSALGAEVARACPPADIVGYTVTQTVRVKIRDFQQAGGILAGAVESGANSVSQLNFTIDNPDAVLAEARAEAIAKAKEQAKAVAKAGGFSVGKLLSIDEGGFQPYLAKYGLGGDAEFAVAAAAPRVEPGSEEVTVQVTLRYEIN